MREPASTRPGGRRRRASAYVAVLSVAAIVTIIGLSALTMVRVQHRGAEGTNHLTQARLYAQGAVEMGMYWIESDPDWRTNLPSGTWASDQPIGDGTFTLVGVDPNDNDLADSQTDPLVLTGTGVSGEARHKLQVTLVPEGSALTCLEVSLHAGNDLIFNAALVQGHQIISANNSVTASSSEIYPDVEAVNTISGGAYGGTRTPGITPRTMPDPNAAFDHYITEGTEILFASLPSSKGKPAISKAVLSPNSNPYGATTNPSGIYVIDCQGQAIVIEDSRIVGTLVLLNPGSGSQVSSAVNWKPAISNYPALLVQGGLDLAFGTDPLSEAALGTSFNPFDTPDDAGYEDDDQLDTYPSEIAGLVYVSADLANTADAPTVHGIVIVGNTFAADAAITLYYDADYLNNPPPGFGDPPTMAISPASWRQVVD